MDFRQAEFTKAAHRVAEWLPDQGAEVAFAGRSNVGKSSAINTLTGRRGLAKTSKTPGRTQQIVFFSIDEKYRLVDLPGYGYAQVPHGLRQHWRRIIESYLTTRNSLRGLIVPMDVRRPLTPLDQQLIEWCQSAGLPHHILLTKSDKLSRSKANNVLSQVKDTLKDSDLHSVQLFSALKKVGLNEARGVITHWLTTKPKA